MAGTEDCSYNAYIDELTKKIDELSQELKKSKDLNEKLSHVIGESQNRNAFLEGQVRAYEFCITQGGILCK